MHAILRQGNGEYYVSAVFGYYRDIAATNSYQRYLERIHKPYFIKELLKENESVLSINCIHPLAISWFEGKYFKKESIFLTKIG